ncbi:hypothetical protein ACH5RR_028227 [Cinchona calisaya]|uniref:Uncharacterized protein n=1 Tax=Cinchona calisaya TaxID=153742 RepID=A0ABD2YQC9_9GENT
MECINSHDEFDNFELSDVDDALLMSFLDDTQVVEDCDDEKLSSVIRSLEAEIDHHSHTIIDDGEQYSLEENNWTSNLSDHDRGHFDGLNNNSRSDYEFDFNWMDMDMNMEMVPSSPSDGMAGWYMDPCGDGMDNIIVTELGSEKLDYYHFQHFNGIPFEDHECCPNGTLWQETNAPLGEEEVVRLGWSYGGMGWGRVAVAVAMGMWIGNGGCKEV